MSNNLHLKIINNFDSIKTNASSITRTLVYHHVTDDKFSELPRFNFKEFRFVIILADNISFVALTIENGKFTDSSDHERKRNHVRVLHFQLLFAPLRLKII